MCRWGYLSRTVENRADKGSGEVGLLAKILLVCDLWSIGVIRPRLSLRVGHGSDVYEEGFPRRAGRRWRGGSEVKGGPPSWMVEMLLGIIRAQRKSIER